MCKRAGNRQKSGDPRQRRNVSAAGGRSSSLLSYSAANDGVEQGAVTKVAPQSAHSCVPCVLRVRSEPNHPGVDDAPGPDSADSLIRKKSALEFGRPSAQLSSGAMLSRRRTLARVFWPLLLACQAARAFPQAEPSKCHRPNRKSALSGRRRSALCEQPARAETESPL